MIVNNLSVALRLRLVTFIPLICLFGFGCWILAGLWKDYSGIRYFPKLLDLVEASGEFRTALARETAETVHANAGHDSEEMPSDLSGHYRRTDAARNAFETAYTGFSGLTGIATPDFTDMYRGLENARRSVASGPSDETGVLHQYQKSGAAVFASIRPFVLTTQETGQARTIAAQILLFEAQEELYYAEAFGDHIIGNRDYGTGSNDALFSLVTSLAKSAEALEGLELALSAEEYSIFRKRLSGSDAETWNRMIRSFSDFEILLPESDAWREAVTERVDLLRGFQQDLLSEATGAIEARAGRAVIVFAVFALLLSGLAAGVIILSTLETKRIIHSLTYVQSKLVALASGELEVDLVEKRAPDRHQDELSSMYAGLVLLKEAAAEQRKLQEEKLRKAEDENRRARAVSAIINDFKTTASKHIRELDQGMAEVRNLSEGVFAAASSTLEKTDAAADDSASSTDLAGTVARTASDLSGEFMTIADRTGHLRDRTSAASSAANGIDEEVSELRQMGEQVSEVMTMISKIADQTALLAMNATIESARAGEAGRGFAVVANEVKALANQTSSSTEEIHNRISQMISAIDRTTNRISEISKNIVEVDENVVAVTTAVDEQVVALSSISESAKHASNKTGFVTDNISDVQEIARNTTSDAEAMKSRSEELADRMKDMRTGIDRFLSEIEAA